MWISNSPYSDVAELFGLKTNREEIKGVIVERGMAGFTTPETHNKWSLRASSTGELVFDNVRVPKTNILPGRDGLGAPLSCLDSARYGNEGTLGAAMDCYDTALRYLKSESSLKAYSGFPVATEKTCRNDYIEITKAQLLSYA